MGLGNTLPNCLPDNNLTNNQKIKAVNKQKLDYEVDFMRQLLVSFLLSKMSQSNKATHQHQPDNNDITPIQS